jgi:hypothetical protein
MLTKEVPPVVGMVTQRPRFFILCIPVLLPLAYGIKLNPLASEGYDYQFLCLLDA